jgi:hypothetical protein
VQGQEGIEMSNWVAAISAAVSALFALLSLLATHKSFGVAREISRKQGIIDLYEAWRDIHMVNCEKPITPNIVRAVNALNLTASFWAHEVINRDILYQMYWEDYDKIYEALVNSDTEVLGLNKTCKQLLTKLVTKVHQEMESYTPLV